MAILGSLTFLLVLIADIPPILTYENVNTKTGYYWLLTGTNTKIGNIIRYSGYFDEPGAMAFWGIYAIIFNRLFIRNNKIENILIVCLLFTFSLAYYLQLFLFLILIKFKKIKHIVFSFIILLVFISGIIALKNEFPVLYTITIERFETSDTGQLKGDNRTALAENAKKVFKQNKLFGIGGARSTQYEGIEDNPYTILAIDGIVGTMILYLPLLSLIFFKPKLILLKALIILFVGYLQRPFTNLPFQYVIMYIFFVCSYFKYIHIKKHKHSNAIQYNNCHI